MISRLVRRKTLGVVAGVAAVGLVLTACGGDNSGSGGGGDSNGNVSLSFLVDNGDATQAQAKALVAAFEKLNPTITITVDSRPGGGDGDNLVKTKLATNEMSDLFEYNAGSLLQALTPDKTLVNLSDQAWVSKLNDNFKTAVSSSSNGVFGVPWGTAFSGAVVYNKDVYKSLNLKIPTTWDEFIANSQKIKAAGNIAPIVQTYGDTWTSQLWILADFFNLQAQVPDWATQYTANKVKYSQQPALQSFLNLETAAKAGLFNKDYASATYDDGVKMVATGTGAQYPILTTVAQNLQQNYPDSLQKVGVFPFPGKTADKNGLTVWMPAAVYIPQSTQGAKLDAAKKFLDFMVTPDACKIIADAGVTGPFVVDGCTLPADVPAVVSDQEPYFKDKKTALALEFVSPVKGPSLEQITVAVGSGITSATDGAKQYDEDVTKQAQQLGLAGW